MSTASRVRVRSLGGAALGCLLLVACGRLFPTKIGEILNHPRQFDGKVVTVKGEVTGSVNVLLLRTYTVQDQTGEMIVVTDRAVPRRGEQLRVRGRVREAFVVGDRALTVLIEGRPGP